MTTPELIVLAFVYAMCLIAYCIGTYADTRARDAVRNMDAEDNADARYAEQMKQVNSWIERTSK